MPSNSHLSIQRHKELKGPKPKPICSKSSFRIASQGTVFKPSASLISSLAISWGVQRKHSCFPPSSPGFESQLCQDFFSLLLNLWTELRLNPSSAKQWISRMQLAVTGAKYYKKRLALSTLIIFYWIRSRVKDKSNSSFCPWLLA